MFHRIKDVDVEITGNVFESLQRYFSTLTHTGYKSYDEVYRLIIYTFIEELINGPMSEFITDDDYGIIYKSLNCLYGSCTIPYPQYNVTVPTKVRVTDKLRATEDNCLRNSEESEYRIQS